MLIIIFFFLIPAVAAQLNSGDASPSLAAQMKQYFLLHDSSSDPAPSALQKTDDSDDPLDDDPPADAASMRVRLFEPPSAPPIEQRTARVLSAGILQPATVDVDIVKPDKQEAPEELSAGSIETPKILSGMPEGLSGSEGAPEALSGNGGSPERMPGTGGVPEGVSGSGGVPEGLSGTSESMSGSGKKEAENNNAVQEDDEMLAQMAMLGSSELRRKQQSLVPKRRRRIGAPILLKRRSAPIVDPRKQRKAPKKLPDSDGIDRIVRSDFLEAQSNNSSTTAATTRVADAKQQKSLKGKSGKRLTGREFWVNALRTLLMEFRRLHPDLARANVRKRGQQSNKIGASEKNSRRGNATTTAVPNIDSWRGANNNGLDFNI